MSWMARLSAVVTCLLNGHDWRIGRGTQGFATCAKCGSKKRL